MLDRPETGVLVIVGLIVLAAILWAIKGLFTKKHPTRGVNVSPQQFERQYIVTAVVAGLVVFAFIIVLALWLAITIR